ncbi:MAG: UDP-N-acetylmuramate--L-alanine ligase [Deferribacteraceae bacterium]|jgi:UDP-N-acetylmuramate--alanine ligase|nr:UDP-N-acetylmuramate--L-alanine ligase [Deferribacteraceae bacterium]
MTNALGFLKKLHFVGIGGIGMSGIAEILHNMDFEVTGSDVAVNSNIERLRGMGIKVYEGHSAENVTDADVLIYSSAVSSDNPELVRAKESYIPVIPRGEMLAELMRMKYAVAVSGSHGKTTTTSIISEILKGAGYDPTTIIGGRLNSDNNNASLGKHNIMVAESDESDRSFLLLYPSVAVITNIDKEHMESYADIDDVKDCFVKFANKVPFYGLNVVCLDDSEVSDIIPRLEKRILTYGLSAQADTKALNVEKNGFSVSFDVEHKGIAMGRVKINLPGDHIILNSLAAIAVALEMRVPFTTVADILERFEGVQRRMSVRYKSDTTMVIDDYGHHPTEIAATLKALHDATPGHKICAIFQPHRYTRTKSLMSEFTKCFFYADHLFVTDIYAASEQPIEGIKTEVLVREINKHGFKDAVHIKDMKEIYPVLEGIGFEQSIIITLGAGNITNFSHEIASYIRGKDEKQIGVHIIRGASK